MGTRAANQLTKEGFSLWGKQKDVQCTLCTLAMVWHLTYELAVSQLIRGGFSLSKSADQRRILTMRQLSRGMSLLAMVWQYCQLADLKGQCHEIFRFWFFSSISFPQSPEYIMRAVSNFFENSRRYSQLKVCHRCQRHRWQMQKISKH
jgi:hypothetical protein